MYSLSDRGCWSGITSISLHVHSHSHRPIVNSQVIFMKFCKHMYLNFLIIWQKNIVYNI